MLILFHFFIHIFFEILMDKNTNIFIYFMKLCLFLNVMYYVVIYQALLRNIVCLNALFYHLYKYWYFTIEGNCFWCLYLGFSLLFYLLDFLFWFLLGLLLFLWLGYCCCSWLLLYFFWLLCIYLSLLLISFLSRWLSLSRCSVLGLICWRWKSNHNVCYNLWLFRKTYKC